MYCFVFYLFLQRHTWLQYCCYFQGVAGSKSLAAVPLEQIRALLGVVDGHGTMLAYSRTPVIVKQMDVMDLRQSRSTLPWLPYWEY